MSVENAIRAIRNPKAVEETMQLIRDSDAKWTSFRFTDTLGTVQQLSWPITNFSEKMFDEPVMFDGSSIQGWQPINESDMCMILDPTASVIDPFLQETTVAIRCSIYNPGKDEWYEKDPRSIGQKAEDYLATSGIADTAYFGPEPEFFIFDGVRWSTHMESCFYEINSYEGAWNSKQDYDAGPNLGHRPRVKGGYFPVPPIDSFTDIRSAMCQAMLDMGADVEKHHHEVGTAGQAEIGIRYNTLVKMADRTQIYKYCVKNVANAHGYTATFMPKPLVGDNGSGMHVHQSLIKDGKSMFAGDDYCGLSQEALWYIGGIFKHAKALNAFTNPTTNSYKRLVPGYEAPVLLQYSAYNRSASCRIPFTPDAARRVEIRFPDPTANPYLAFSAMLMAGLDGIKNQIDPGIPAERDLYELTAAEEREIPHVAPSLNQALIALDNDRAFLKEGGVFTDTAIDAYIELLNEDVKAIRLVTHPLEFEMYYSR